MLSNVEQANAERAIASAQECRKRLARHRRKGSPERNADIDRELHRLKLCMRPVRSFLARTQFEPDAPGRFEALNLSFRMQRERRKLWKLRQPAKHSDVS